MTVELGRRIRALRRLKLVTQQELAERLNISVSMLSNIERGQRTPAPPLLERIALSLDVPGDELFFLSGPGEVEGDKQAAGRGGG